MKEFYVKKIESLEKLIEELKISFNEEKEKILSKYENNL